MREGELTEHTVIHCIFTAKDTKRNRTENLLNIKMYTKGEDKQVFMNKTVYLIFTRLMSTLSSQTIQLGSRRRCMNPSLSKKDRRNIWNREVNVTYIWPTIMRRRHGFKVLLVLALPSKKHFADIYSCSATQSGWCGPDAGRYFLSPWQQHIPLRKVRVPLGMESEFNSTQG